MAVDNSTYAFLLAEYGADGARQAVAEIEFWQDTGRLPTWAMCLQQIIEEGYGSVIYVHRDSRKRDGDNGQPK